MPRLEIARVIRNTPISDRLWWCEYEAPEIAATARPGQFAHVLCGPADAYDPMLRRPLSFSRIEPGDGRIALLIEIVGRGTDWLVHRPPGALVDFIGPLGNWFEFQPERPRALLVGGGIGLAPLIALADIAAVDGVMASLLCGGRDRQAITPSGYIAAGVDYAVATEDGSQGRSGLVTELAIERFDAADQIFVCGPTAMLRAMARLTRQREDKARPKPVFSSLEARMGCAMGVCYSCVVRTTHGIKRVCCDGPVFPQNELRWQWTHG